MVDGCRVGIDERLFVPYAPASTIGPCLTACTVRLSAVDSRCNVIGKLTSTTSPFDQVRLIEAYEPGVTGACSVPLTRICAPAAQLGMRTRNSNVPEPVIVSFVAAVSG